MLPGAAEYRPVKSRLVDSADPSPVAEALRSQFTLSELYVADLDAIGGTSPALDTFRELLRRGFRLWADAGVRDRERADLLAAVGVDVVVGLETVAGPDALNEVMQAHSSHAVFSLDLREGAPMGDRAAWGDADAYAIAERAVSLGAPRLLVLDLRAWESPAAQGRRHCVGGLSPHSRTTGCGPAAGSGARTICPGLKRPACPRSSSHPRFTTAP